MSALSNTQQVLGNGNKITNKNDSNSLSWPAQVREKYERISLLGQGSFGGVYLAKPLSKTKTDDDKVAVKFIDMSTKVAQSYAEREIAILSVISHPNMISLIESFDCVTTKSSKCLVLTLAKGPTIDSLLKIGGALGFPLAKLICKQLLNIVAYLHCHAIMHRDLKPDNLILVGTNSHYNSTDLDYDDDIWNDNVVDIDSKNWKLILIDFGFARALHPDELKYQSKQQNEIKDQNNKESTAPMTSLNSPLDPTIDSSSHHGKSRRLSSSWSLHKKKYVKKIDVMDNSYSKDVMEMSAIGSKGYTAPEVYNGARQNKKYGKISKGSYSHFGDTYRKHTPTSLAPCVADYSMSADGFSVGCILRHIFTGVPPNISIEEYVSTQNNPFLLLIKYLTYCASSNKKKYRLSPRIRYNDEVPKEITSIIRGLTTSNIKDRLSVRASYRRLLPFDYNDDQNDLGFDLNRITFLKYATASNANESDEKRANSTSSTLDTSGDSDSTVEIKPAPIVVCKE